MMWNGIFRLILAAGFLICLGGSWVRSATAQDSKKQGQGIPPDPAAIKEGDVIPPITQPMAELGFEIPADQPNACGCVTIKEPPKSILATEFVGILPRTGNFPIPPKGKGYYSVLDYLTGQFRDAPPKRPYSPISPMIKPFFDSDFRYLASPKNQQFHYTDPLHQIQFGDNWLLSVGGEFRWRHMNEVDSRLTGRANNYDLMRTRVYGDLRYKDLLRMYVEFIDAHNFNSELPPLGIDVNRSDLLNAFFDVKVAEIRGAPVYTRIGRQELLLGSQRLVSPLDWANTRRTFEGVRTFRQGEKFDFNLFWAQPVKIDPSSFDRTDSDQNFAGLWTTYRPNKGDFLDMYYLFLDDDSPRKLLGQTRAFPISVHTLGARYAGDNDNFLWDFGGSFQFGERGSSSIFAGAATGGVGYHFADVPLNPTFWFYYDYASGTQNPDSGGQFSTYNQLFPFGHFYLGWLDLVARQNIHDVNAHLFLFPTKWITVWLQFHHFELDSRRDALYNAGGVPLRRDPTGSSGRNVGNEFDLVLNFHLAQNSDIFMGYSKLFPGGFLQRTAPGNSPELFFVQYSYRW